ncbi:MAG: alpha/beta hydrolase [Actinocatenispora sp.]
MSRRVGPAMPVTTTSQFYGRFGRLRSRALGNEVTGVPEIVLVQGMGVADYLLPALATLGDFTRAHLLDLPGLSGSADPPEDLDLGGYADAVAEWLADRPGAKPVVLAGHSAGTQIAARAAVGHPQVVGLVLASPTTDPATRGLTGMAARWRRDGQHEPPGLTPSHLPEWRRAGPLRLLRLARLCLDDRIERSLRRLTVPHLVVYCRDDRISSAAWSRSLADIGDGRFVTVGGAHTFVWADPGAWRAPIRQLTDDVSRAGRNLTVPESVHRAGAG